MTFGWQIGKSLNTQPRYRPFGAFCLMTYRIYLRDAQQQVSDKTVTSSQDVAIAAFKALTERVDLDGSRMLAVLNRDGKPVAHHDFSKPAPPAPGCDPARWWRGRVHEVDFTKAG